MKRNGQKYVDTSPQEIKGAGAYSVVSLSWFRVLALMLVKELLFGYSCSSTPICLPLSISLQDDDLQHFPFLCCHHVTRLVFPATLIRTNVCASARLLLGSPVNQRHLNPSSFGPGIRGK